MLINDNGKTRELTNEEMVSIQSEKLQPQRADLTIDEKITIIANSVIVEKPTDSNDLPLKLGYKWEPIYNGSSIAWVSVKDDNAIGTENNPIIWVDDGSVPLIDNAYYIVNGVRNVYMNGQFIEF